MMEKRSLLRIGMELYKCLMLTVVAVLLLLVLSASRRAEKRAAQWTQENPLPVDVVGRVEVVIGEARKRPVVRW
jgi:hypothetical protein